MAATIPSPASAIGCGCSAGLIGRPSAAAKRSRIRWNATGNSNARWALGRRRWGGLPDYSRRPASDASLVHEIHERHEKGGSRNATVCQRIKRIEADGKAESLTL